MKKYMLTVLTLFLACAGMSFAQEEAVQEDASFEKAASTVEKRLEDSLAELSRLHERVAEETIPLSRELSDLESDLTQVRIEYQKTTRLLDSRTLDLTNLRNEIKSRNDEATYLSNLLSEYIRNFESRLHISEKQRYDEDLDKAKLAAENSSLSDLEVFQAQTELLSVSLDHLCDALGGMRFEGTAVDSNGLVKNGTFVMIGPAALFRSEDGQEVGTAEQRIGSFEPTVLTFGNPLDTEQAAAMVMNSAGQFPLDPTLGNAHKIEATQETLWEHIQKGGTVMVPIFCMAGAALLVSLFKWLSLAFVRKPSKRRVQELLNALEDRNIEGAKQKIAAIKGPVGKMLSKGIANIKESRDLIEEVMYETVLTTRIKLQKYLPFIAICAASAPLLGLLGTVTGIINTFKLITVFGSGDVKTLSGGISEALITTEFGLIVAVPSLLLHAFLFRKARGVINYMETTAISFMNQITKSFPSDPTGRYVLNPVAVGADGMHMTGAGIENPTADSQMSQMARALETGRNNPEGEEDIETLNRKIAALKAQIDDQQNREDMKADKASL